MSRLIRRMACLLGVVWSLAGAAVPAPLLRVTPLPDSVSVGQVVPVEVAVLVPGWFSAPVELPASIEVAGATARLAEGSSANLNERIDGVSYAGIRRHYEVVAARAGTLSIPPVSVRFQWSDGGAARTQALATPPLRLVATLPGGMEDLGYFIATRRFELAQSIDRPLAGLKVGDAFTRTLSQRAEGMPAMQLPALRQTALQGLAVYADAAFLDTLRGERGAPDRAVRRERFTYVLQAAGDYELPGMALDWYDTGAGIVRRARVPALRFTVAPGAPPMAAAGPAREQAGAVLPASTWRTRWLAQASAHWPWLLAPVLLVLVRVSQPRWQPRLAAWRQRAWPPRRAARLRSLRLLLRSNLPADQLRAIDAWRIQHAGKAQPHPPGEPAMARLLHAVHGPCPATGPVLSRWAALRLLWRVR